MTFTRHERDLPRQIGRDLARDDPRLARLLSTPSRAHRARLRRRRVTVLAVTLAVLTIPAIGTALTMLG